MELKYGKIPHPGNSTSQYITVEVSEADSNWDEVFQFLRKYAGFNIYGAGDQFQTFFSDEEIRQAEWAWIIPMFEQGYPQPGSLEKRLIWNSACPECGLYEQAKPIRMQKEPKLKNNSFMTQIADAKLFVVPEVFSSLEEIGAKGFEKWDVIIHKTNQPSQKVSQIYVPGVAKPGLIGSEDLKRRVCPKCGTIKYYPHKKGPMKLKKGIIPPETDFIRTNEWFGDGLIAYQELLVSNRVAKLFLDKGWKGIRLKVIDFD